MIPYFTKIIICLCTFCFVIQVVGCTNKQTNQKVKEQSVMESLSSKLDEVTSPIITMYKDIEGTVKQKIWGKSLDENKNNKHNKYASKPRVIKTYLQKKNQGGINKKSGFTSGKNSQGTINKTHTVTLHNEAHLSSNWDNSALKYLAVDGYRYTHEDIYNHIEFLDDSILKKSPDGELRIALEKKFELEIAFYPPNTAGHETFKPFQITVLNNEKAVIHQEEINNRIQVYTITK